MFPNCTGISLKSLESWFKEYSGPMLHLPSLPFLCADDDYDTPRQVILSVIIKIKEAMAASPFSCVSPRKGIQRGRLRDEARYKNMLAMLQILLAHAFTSD